MSRQGGLVNKKMTKFATMSDYLEAHHPKVYELFTYLGMQGALTPRRGGGLTLLIPDSKTVADLHKTIESDDAEKASDMLSGMVIQDNLGSEEDWKRVQDDVPTLLGKRVPVKSVMAGKIVLEGGAELTLDKSAKFLSRTGRKTRDPMSVWLMKGSFDPTSAPDATYKYVSKEGKGKKEKGGKVRGGFAAPDDIWKTHMHRAYVDGVLNEVGGWLMQGGFTSGIVNPAAREMVKLINYVETTNNAEVAQLLHAFCRGCPLSDFLVIWKNPLVAKSFALGTALSEAIQKGFNNEDVKDVYKRFLTKTFAGSSYLTATAQGRLTLDEKVEEYLYAGLTRPDVKFAAKVQKACDEIEKNNSIGGLGPIFADNVHKLLQQNPGLFLLAEEHFYFICPRWNALRKMTGPETQQLMKKMWSELLSDIKVRFDSSTDPSKMTRMDQPNYYSTGGLTDHGLLQNCVTFWRSAFMRWNPVDSVSGGFDQDEFEDPYSRELTNLRALGAAELEEIQDSENQGLSERARLEIMAYKQRHGKLPDF